METGIKHLIECRCILPQFKNKHDAPLHQFVVFSVLDEDVFKVKFAQCNNCYVIHKVTDICTSEIMTGREHMNSIMSIDEIKLGLPKELITIFETQDVDLATWEQAKWIIDNKKWGEHIVIMSELIDGTKQGKYVTFIGEKLFKVDTFLRDDIVSYGAIK